MRTEDTELQKQLETEIALVPMRPDPPEPRDRADEEIQASHYRFRRSWLLSTIALSVYGLWATEGLVRESHKPPERIYVRILPNGEFVQSRLTDYAYVPKPNDALSYLERWATLRYTRTRDTIQTDFPKNYWFFEKSLGEQTLASDAKRNLVANLVSGATPENKVERVQATILRFETRTVEDLQIGVGEALLDVIVRYPEMMREPHPQRVHLRVGVSFLLNPADVQKKSMLWPEYGRVNNAGLEIIKPPFEQAVEDK